MNRPWLQCGAILATAVAISLGFSSLTPAQGTAPAGSGQTPHMANGRPDLSGMWAQGNGNEIRDYQDIDPGIDVVEAFPSRRCGPGQRMCDEHTNQANDGEFTGRSDSNRPLYKPEFWDRIQNLDENTNREDPIFRCQPQGIPRTGPPAKIIQTAGEIVFFYGDGAYYRIIPIDGRKHDADQAGDITFWGHAVGHWEADTLVIESVGFNDQVWLARGGLIQSDNMTITERLRREGNRLQYDVTVRDPGVLLEPWVMTTRRLALNTNPKAYIAEATPCRDVDSAHIVTKIRH